MRGREPGLPCDGSARSYLTDSVHEVVLKMSKPVQMRQGVLYISNDKGQVDGFLGESTFAEQLHEPFL